MLRQLLILLIVFFTYGQSELDLKFPDDFIFGVSSSAFQTEGAWNEGGKGESIWDRMIHTKPEVIAHNASADDSVKSYELYERDIEMLKEMNVQFYRFSISWPRILPNGRADHINRIGVNYYNTFINRLLEEGIEPMVTLYHWDLPQVLEDEGGFLNSSFPLVFEDYARVAFDLFGDRVKKWVTFNEPYEVCIEGYGNVLRAPMRNYHGYGEYICMTNLLTAHARAWHLYDSKYRSHQKGIVGYAIGAQLSLSMTDSKDDQQAAREAQQFYVGLMTHPVFSNEGGYPKEVIQRVSKDRMPKFADPHYVRNASDFIGINHYDVYLVTRRLPRSHSRVPSFDNDLDISWISVRRWSKQWLKRGPSGFGQLLKWVQKTCNDPLIYITESGIAGGPGLDDIHRVWYHRRYALEMLKAIKDEVKIKGFAPWSLTDNFEWLRGYTERYGFYQVDFDDFNKTRTPRRSAVAYGRMASTKTIDLDHLNDVKWEEGQQLENLSLYKFKPQFDLRPTSERGIERKRNQSDVDYAIDLIESQLITFNKPFQPDYMYLDKELN